MRGSCWSLRLGSLRDEWRPASMRLARDGPVLAAAVRLLDLGFFRPGGDEYAEENGTFGLATIQRSHVQIAGDETKSATTAKGSKEREQSVIDDDVKGVIEALKRRRSGTRLLAYRCGRRWHEVTAAVSEYAAASEPAANRATARVVREVADDLGNTPAVARAS